jgi:hypothetical protein
LKYLKRAYHKTADSMSSGCQQRSACINPPLPFQLAQASRKVRSRIYEPTPKYPVLDSTLGHRMKKIGITFTWSKKEKVIQQFNTASGRVGNIVLLISS